MRLDDLPPDQEAVAVVRRVDRPSPYPDKITRAEELRLRHAAPKPLLLGRHLVARGWRPSKRFGCLLHEAFDYGGPVLKHVGADTGFGFGVGGGVGVETDGFGGLTVGHGSRKDQAGKGYFLIRDEIVDLIFGHRCSVLSVS